MRWNMAFCRGPVTVSDPPGWPLSARSTNLLRRSAPRAKIRPQWDPFFQDSGISPSGGAANRETKLAVETELSGISALKNLKMSQANWLTQENFSKPGILISFAC
jgi:hypothetical protein